MWHTIKTEFDFQTQSKTYVIEVNNIDIERWLESCGIFPYIRGTAYIFKLSQRYYAELILKYPEQGWFIQTYEC
jgi:hypothetical protein